VLLRNTTLNAEVAKDTDNPAARESQLPESRTGIITSLVPTEPSPTGKDQPSSGDTFVIRGWRRLVVRPLGILAQLWGRSLRFEISGEDRRNLEWDEQPVVFILWHNRLFLASEFYRRYRRRPMRALVSASRDGAWLAEFFATVGIGTVRGSTSRFGREAMTALARVVRAGEDIAVTPDGPRGPCYDFKPGALVAARRTRAPILLLGAEFRGGWRLHTWDRFHLPLPFSTVRVHCRRLDPVETGDRDRAAAEIVRIMAEINPDRG
jgi:lysophospholipid acyltransferase (LPLAT)-like uncharacterized protein